MSKFSDFAHLGTTTHETVAETTAPPVPPAPPEPVVVESDVPPVAPPTTPPGYENPLDDMPVAVAPSAEAEAFSVDDLQWMSKVKLEEIGRSLGVELDRRLSQPKLVRQIKEVIEQQQD
tara:strand:+ start:250 stop:606 length:357 start_codon:yes stop_codon:yes gene_type:complete